MYLSVRRQVSKLYRAVPSNDFLSKFVAFFLTFFLVIILPYLHIGVFYLKFWVPDKPQVNRETCSCSCFDTVFKGSYESPNRVSYKHVYFNATSTTFKIWVVTALFILLLYESLRYLVNMLATATPLRPSMLLLYLVNLYPHYYSWWAIFGYYNDEFHAFLTHQLVFTVTELIVTAIVLDLCNANNPLSSWKPAVVISISLIHIIVSGLDQFIANVLGGQGRAFQNARDLGFMVPDILHVIVPLRALCLQARQQNSQGERTCHRREILLVVIFVSVGTVLGRVVFV